MKLHLGRVENPTSVVTDTDGYWFKDYDDDQFRHVSTPQRITRPLRRLFGVSIGKIFIGLMMFEKAKSKTRER